MKKAMLKAQLALTNAKNAAVSKALDFARSESGEVNVIAIVLIIVVAIALVALFRERLMDMINRILGDIDTNATDIVTATQPPAP